MVDVPFLENLIPISRLELICFQKDNGLHVVRASLIGIEVFLLFFGNDIAYEAYIIFHKCLNLYVIATLLTTHC